MNTQTAKKAMERTEMMTIAKAATAPSTSASGLHEEHAERLGRVDGLEARLADADERARLLAGLAARREVAEHLPRELASVDEPDQGVRHVADPGLTHEGVRAGAAVAGDDDLDGLGEERVERRREGGGRVGLARGRRGHRGELRARELGLPAGEDGE